MRDLEYTTLVEEDGHELYFFTLPPSYENSTVSLVLGNTLLMEMRFEPRDYPTENLWMSSPLSSKYKNLKPRIIHNFFGHNGFEETELFYIHPQKCGGSSIEMTGYEYGVRWAKWLGRDTYHHYHATSPYFMEEKKDLIKDKVLFTSVRNPYTRLISGVYCPYSQFKENRCGLEVSLSDFNDIIRTRLDTEKPTYEYVYYNNKKVIPHVLKMENLTQEFNKLMSDYNNNIRMSNISNSSSYYYDYKKFGVEDINKNLIKDINSRYRLDFEYFDYKKIV